MNQTHKSLVAFVSLFFTITTSLAPVSASAAFFTWNQTAKPINVTSTSAEGTSWSFERLFDDTTSTQPNRTSQSLMLGFDTVVKKKIFGTPAIAGLTYVVEASAYSSTPDQTDDSPFITAKGTHVRPGIIAANFLPFGTIVKIPEIFGDRTFTVEDRMNSRYQKHIDVWFSDRDTAMKFGRKNVVIEIASQ